MPEADKGVISIYHLDGRLLKTYEAEFNEGENQFEIDLSDTDMENELLLFTIRTTRKMLQGKMMMTKY